MRGVLKAVLRARYFGLIALVLSACGGGDTGGGFQNSTPSDEASPVLDTSWQSGASSQAQAGEPFEFVAYGDSRAGTACGDNAIHLRLVARMAAEQPALVFHLGDMVAGSRPTTNWVQSGNCTAPDAPGSLKTLIAPLQTRTPPTGYPTSYFPIIGNHDDNWGSGWYPDAFGDGFCEVFSARTLFPNHTAQPYYSTVQSITFSDADFYRLACSKNPAQRDVYPAFMYYSFNYRNSHFVVLRINNDDFNLEECGGGWKCDGDKANYDKYYNIHQLDWLRSDLAAASADARIENIFVFLHTPLFTNYNHPPNVSRAILLPEFSQHKVRLVFSGHNHVYERSVPIYANGTSLVRDDVNGTTYVVTGGGGSPLDTNYRGGETLIDATVYDYHYVKVRVTGNKVTLKAIDVNGVERDSFAN